MARLQNLQKKLEFVVTTRASIGTNFKNYIILGQIRKFDIHFVGINS